MEKISFKDLLALLLPGFFFILSMALVNHFCYEVFTFNIQSWGLFWLENNVLIAIGVLLLFVVSGAGIARLTYWFTENRNRKKYYQKITGLYKPTGLIFEEIKSLQPYLYFFNIDCASLFQKEYWKENVNTQ